MTKPKISLKNKAFARSFVKHKGDRKKAYREVYPASSIKSAEVSACRLLSNDNIREYTLELLNASPDLNIDALLTSLKDDINAEKIVFAKPDAVAHRVRDNSTALEAKKTLLKLYGALSDHKPLIDNRSVNLTISNADADRLQAIADDLRRLNAEVIRKRDDYIAP